MTDKYAIVVDTNIVRAVSGKANNGVHRKILLALRDKGYLLAISKPLLEEWFKLRDAPSGQWRYYIAYFAYTWLVEMRNRKLVKEYKIDDSLEKRILSRVPVAKTGEVKKDVFLVLTALAADKRLISNDKRLKKDIHEAAEGFTPLCELIWPPLEHVLTWLLAGAQRDDEFLLC